MIAEPAQPSAVAFFLWLLHERTQNHGTELRQEFAAEILLVAQTKLEGWELLGLLLLASAAYQILH